jgi:excisionase family DNA binding protein
MKKKVSGKELEQLLAEATVSVEESGRVLGLSRNFAYEAVKNGDIPSIRFGRIIRVPTAPLRKMLAI